MAATPEAILKLLTLKFPQAIEFFNAKLAVPTDKWDDIFSQFRDYAFTVAGVTSAQMLGDIQSAVTKQLTQPDGTNYRQFIKEFKTIAETNGWKPREGIAHRGLLVLQTNLRTAYSAGRNEQMNTPEMIARRPYRIRKHRQCRNPRPLHLAWNNLILPYDDPFIASNPCPGGFACGCTYYSLSEKEAERRGGVSETPDPGTKTYTDKQGKTHTISKGVDPGFENQPGMPTIGASMGRIQRELIAGLPEGYRSQVESQSNLLPLVEPIKKQREPAKLPAGVTKKKVEAFTNYVFEVGGKTVDVLFDDFRVEKYGTDITFTVGDLYSKEKSGELSDRDRATTAVKISKILKYDAEQRADGHRYKCSAFADEDGLYRAYAYTKMGFSQPLTGNPGDDQYAIVQDGRLEPNLDKIEELSGNLLELYEERWLKQLAKLDEQRGKERKAKSGKQGSFEEFMSKTMSDREVLDRYFEIINSDEPEAKIIKDLTAFVGELPDAQKTLIDADLFRTQASTEN